MPGAFQYWRRGAGRASVLFSPGRTLLAVRPDHTAHLVVLHATGGGPPTCRGGLFPGELLANLHFRKRTKRLNGVELRTRDRPGF